MHTYPLLNPGGWHASAGMYLLSSMKLVFVIVFTTCVCAHTHYLVKQSLIASYTSCNALICYCTLQIV